MNTPPAPAGRAPSSRGPNTTVHARFAMRGVRADPDRRKRRLDLGRHLSFAFCVWFDESDTIDPVSRHSVKAIAVAAVTGALGCTEFTKNVAISFGRASRPQCTIAFVNKSLPTVLAERSQS